jgi:hypothetical protein
MLADLDMNIITYLIVSSLTHVLIEENTMLESKVLMLIQSTFLCK